MTMQADIVIAGGGLNGPAMALAAAQAGLRAVVVDAASPADLRAEDFDGRGYALAHASVRMLTALGVWGAVAAHAQPIERIEVRGQAGASPVAGFLAFDCGEIEEGPMGWVVEDRFLRRALLDALEGNPALALLSETRVTGHAPGPAGVRVETTAGPIAARLLVGADGRQSATARRSGLPRRQVDYGQTAIVCAIAHDRPHEGTAHQVFRAEGPFAVLPLPGARSSIVWAEPHALAAEILRRDAPGFAAALGARLGGLVGAFTVEGGRFSYPLSLSLARSMVAPRVALVGDAAHGIHPLAGQGLNLGLRDVATLAQVLAEANRRGEDVGSDAVLARYRGWRQFDTAAMALGTHAVNAVWSTPNPARAALGGLALSVANRLAPLRRAMIREAAGLAGELPDLLRGRPL